MVRQLLDSQLACCSLPVFEKNPSLGGALDNTTFTGGVDPESFMMTRSFSGLDASASVEVRLLEAQNRIRSLASETQRHHHTDTEVAQERLRAAQAERSQADARSRAGELESINRSLLEELEAEKQARKQSRDAQRQLATKDREIERLKAQLADATAMNQHALEVSRQPTAQSSALGGLSSRGSSSVAVEAERRVLRVELDRAQSELAVARTRLVNLEDLEAECRQLRARLTDVDLSAAKRGFLEESERGALRLREENNLLKQKLARAQGMSQKLVRVESELERERETLAKWKVVVSGEYPSLEHVQQTVGRLEAQVNALRAEKTGLEEALQSAQTETRQLGGKLRAERLQIGEKVTALEEQRRATVRVQEETKVLKERLAANQAILESFNAEGASFSSYDKPKSERIMALEKQLAEQGKLDEGLESECNRLGRELDGARERMAVLEGRLTEGEFDPDSVQVLHFRMNPLAAADEKTQQLAQLSSDNQMLRKRLAASKKTGASSSEMVTLKKDNVNLAKRLDRLKQIAQAKITEFREIVVLLFGYRVDVEFDAHVYTLTAASNPENKLKFKASSGGLQLLETDYALILAPSVTQYLENFDSIPAFLSAITLQEISE